MYLTYAEYQGYGGTLSESDFTLAEFRARKRIDYLTDSRVADMEEVPEEVKLCEMSLITLNSKTSVEAQAENPLVTSFNNDGYSENYGSALEQTAAMQKSMDNMIREMLYGVTNDQGIPLLYRGLDV